MPGNGLQSALGERDVAQVGHSDIAPPGFAID